MLPLLSPIYNIRDPATIIIREVVYSLVNKEDDGMPVHTSSASVLRPCFPQHTPCSLFEPRYPFQCHNDTVFHLSAQNVIIVSTSATVQPFQIS